jgi:hypothetical protein
LIKKKYAECKDARYLFDQINNKVSKLYEVIMNAFDVCEILKIKLNFLAILYCKKEFLQAEFGQNTMIEL